MQEKLNGQISVARLMGGGEEDSIRIEVIDELSRSHFLDIRMTPEAFGKAITGASHQPCVFALRSSVVGVKHEYKDEVVAIECKSYDKKARQEAAVAALRPFEVDGWKGHVDDLLNHHRNVGDNRYRVSFYRHVAA